MDSRRRFSFQHRTLHLAFPTTSYTPKPALSVPLDNRSMDTFSEVDFAYSMRWSSSIESEFSLEEISLRLLCFSCFKLRILL